MKQCPRITVFLALKEDQTYLVVSDTKKYVLVVFKKIQDIATSTPQTYVRTTENSLDKKLHYGSHKVVLQ